MRYITIIIQNRIGRNLFHTRALLQTPIIDSTDKKEMSRALLKGSTHSRRFDYSCVFGFFLIENARIMMICAGTPSRKICHQLYSSAVR